MPWRACERESGDGRHGACGLGIGPARAKRSRCGPQRTGLGRTWRAPTNLCTEKRAALPGPSARAQAAPKLRVVTSGPGKKRLTSRAAPSRLCPYKVPTYFPIPTAWQYSITPLACLHAHHVLIRAAGKVCAGISSRSARVRSNESTHGPTGTARSTVARPHKLTRCYR